MAKVKRKKPISISEKELAHEYRHMNHHFFGGQLPSSMKITFNSRTTNAMRADGIYFKDDLQIHIAPTLKKHPRLAKFILIHEMIHASLPEYKGYPNEGGHGMLFQSKLNKMYEMGIYDGYL